MFPDSAIAQKFSCGERKCAYVTSRYLSSKFLGHSSATDMFQKIMTCLTDNSVSMSKVVQLSMDGPNVNLKLHALMDEDIQSLLY